MSSTLLNTIKMFISACASAAGAAARIGLSHFPSLYYLIRKERAGSSSNGGGSRHGGAVNPRRCPIIAGLDFTPRETQVLHHLLLPLADSSLALMPGQTQRFWCRQGLNLIFFVSFSFARFFYLPCKKKTLSIITLSDENRT